MYYWKSHHQIDGVAYSTNLERLVTQISQQPFTQVSTLPRQPTGQGLLNVLYPSGQEVFWKYAEIWTSLWYFDEVLTLTDEAC